MNKGRTVMTALIIIMAVVNGIIMIFYMIITSIESPYKLDSKQKVNKFILRIVFFPYNFYLIIRHIIMLYVNLPSKKDDNKYV